jgi:DNA polymerase epsilon subunit 2
MARRLVKTILDQGTISPFPLPLRPVLWDHASALQLYPLPTALVLADPEAAPFCMTYEGCHVMNPGRLLPEGGAPMARWVEYDVLRNRGKVREERC